jgi:hypothetical protein
MIAPHRARERPCSQGIDERRLGVAIEEIRPSLAFATAALTQIVDGHVVVAAAGGRAQASSCATRSGSDK